MRALGVVLILACTISFNSGVSGEACNWPMFRGDQARSGVCQSECMPGANDLLWTFQTQGAVESSPAIVDGKAYIGSFDGYLYCLDLAMGKPDWKFKTTGGVKSSPCVDSGKVYIGSTNQVDGKGGFYCVDSKSGEKI